MFEQVFFVRTIVLLFEHLFPIVFRGPCGGPKGAQAPRGAQEGRGAAEGPRGGPKGATDTGGKGLWEGLQGPRGAGPLGGPTEAKVVGWLPEYDNITI